VPVICIAFVVTFDGKRGSSAAEAGSANEIRRKDVRIKGFTGSGLARIRADQSRAAYLVAPTGVESEGDGDAE
jgi:hypothetical protein